MVVNGQRPLRVAMVLPATVDGGAGEVCAALVAHLRRYGHEVTVFDSGAGPGRCRFDVVHTHLSDAARAGSPVGGVPHVVTVHGRPGGHPVGPGTALVATSQAQRRLRPDLAWTATVPNGVEVSRLEPSGGPVRDRYGPVLSLGRCDDAVAACRAAGLPLILTGGGPSAGHAPGLTLEVDPDRQRYRQLLATARCLLVPVPGTVPFGPAMLVAMAAGTPVVALRRGVAAEVVAHGRSGLLCDDPDGLPEALHRVPRLYRTGCVRHVRDTFPAELMAGRYEQLYRRLVRDNGPDRKGCQAPDWPVN